MNVFISWSGDRSKAVAELLSDWIKCVLQASEPWMSSKDVDRGTLWFSEITDQLKDTHIGIVCLTKANKDRPWILFESGALAKGLTSSRVCTFLIDLDSTEVSGPLAQFNHTQRTETDVYSLVETLNTAMGDKALPQSTLETVFQTYWPQFDTRLSEIIETPTNDVEPPDRSEDSILEELLNTVRTIDKRVRSLERTTKDGYDLSLSAGMGRISKKMRPERPVSMADLLPLSEKSKDGGHSDEDFPSSLRIVQDKDQIERAIQFLQKRLVRLSQ